MTAPTTKVSKPTPMGARLWASILLFGLIGQLSWVVENVYFSTFIQKQITTDAWATSATVAASAICAALATFFGGALSDRLGKRKPFVCFGYIAWGIITASFAMFSTNAISVENGSSVVAIVSLFVVMDCVMTLVGSLANDAAFSAWISDNTDITNRGFTDTILSILPVAALIIVMIGLGWLTDAGNWTAFFLLIGGVTTATGIIGIFLFKDSKTLKPDHSGHYLKDVVYGFRPSTIKNNKMVYVCYIGMMFSALSMQLWQPQMIMLIQYTVGLENFVPPLGIVVVLSAVSAALLGKLMDKHGKDKFFIPLVVSGVIGGLLVYLIKFIGTSFAARFIIFCIGGTLVETASLVAAGVFIAAARDYIPKGKSGRFQGVKIIIYVTLPMVLASLISPFIIKGFGEIVTAESVLLTNGSGYKLGDYVYPFEMFLFAAVSALMMIVPALIVKKDYKNFREEKLKAMAESQKNND